MIGAEPLAVLPKLQKVLLSEQRRSRSAWRSRSAQRSRSALRSKLCLHNCLRAKRGPYRESPTPCFARPNFQGKPSVSLSHLELGPGPENHRPSGVPSLLGSLTEHKAARPSGAGLFLFLSPWLYYRFLLLRGSPRDSCLDRPASAS